jgi:hypothetical protein
MALHLALVEWDFEGALTGEDCEWLKNLLFEDEDVLLLFEPEMDGAWDDPVIQGRMGYAHLNPPEWFVPFSTAEILRNGEP